MENKKKKKCSLSWMLLPLAVVEGIFLYREHDKCLRLEGENKILNNTLNKMTGKVVSEISRQSYNNGKTQEKFNNINNPENNFQE